MIPVEGICGEGFACWLRQAPVLLSVKTFQDEIKNRPSGSSGYKPSVTITPRKKILKSGEPSNQRLAAPMPAPISALSSSEGCQGGWKTTSTLVFFNAFQSVNFIPDLLHKLCTCRAAGGCEGHLDIDGRTININFVNQSQRPDIYIEFLDQ